MPETIHKQYAHACAREGINKCARAYFAWPAGRRRPYHYPTEAAHARALLTAREARLPTNLCAWRKLDFLRMTEVYIPKRD